MLAGNEDVAGEVWLEVARGLARFKGGEQEFRGWLLTLARRRVTDMPRYDAPRPVRLTADAGTLDRPGADDTATAALDNPSTEAAVALIATLLREQAEVIVLRFIAGLDMGKWNGLSASALAPCGSRRIAGCGHWPPGWGGM